MDEPDTGLVVFCYDGSEDSLSALRHAATNLASGPRLVVTAWQTVATRLRATAGFAMVGDTSESDDDERRAAEHAAADGARLAAEAGMVSDHLAIEAAGPVWEALVNIAAERRAALIVCGAKGRASFHDVIFGRTSTGLLHHAPCPVLIARETAHRVR